MFNALNRVQFGWPSSSLGSLTFGEVTGTAPGVGPRNVQFDCASTSEFGTQKESGLTAAPRQFTED
jgi:hypothetical protein